jgi:hypothetical protein
MLTMRETRDNILDGMLSELRVIGGVLTTIQIALEEIAKILASK